MSSSFLDMSPSHPPSGTGGKPAAAREAAAKPLAGRAILVVEDEVLLAMDLQYTLEEYGAEVVGPAHRICESEALVEEAQIDAAILDLNLHGEEIYPFARLLEKKGIPFIFHTGHGCRTELRSIFPDVTVCQKPILPDALVEALLTALYRPD